jgi:hypothetical protein
MNQKDERIIKLYRKGLSLAVIAKKIGYTDIEEGIQRVKEGLKRNNIDL